MHGAEVLAALRLDPVLASVPVVVLSADVSEGQMQAALAAGAHSFLNKPLVVRGFLATLDIVLERAA